MSHYHDPSAATQNQGNVLGSRACVKQSWRAKQQESGNAVKGILGYGNIQWSAVKRSTTVNQHRQQQQRQRQQKPKPATAATKPKQQKPKQQQPKPKGKAVAKPKPPPATSCWTTSSSSYGAGL